MTISVGARQTLGYIAETVPGTTPATPQLKGVPFTSTTLNLSRDSINDPSIRGDRMKRFHRSGNRSVGGNVSVSFAPAIYDDFLEGVFMNTWATNVLKIGSIEKSYTVEIGSPDVAQFRSFNGCHIGSFTLNVPSGNSLVTGEFEVLGMNGAVGTTTLDTSGGIDYSAATSDPFVHLDGTYNEGGTAVAYFTGLQITIQNALTANYALGSAGARAITAGMSTVTGQVTAYWESSAMYTKWINETNSTLNFTLVSGTASQAWVIPKVRYSASNIPVSGDGPVIQTLSFEALYDATSNSTIQITRSA